MFNDKTLFLLCIYSSSPALVGLKDEQMYESPLSSLFQQAGMNNVMMLCVVFISDQDSLI